MAKNSDERRMLGGWRTFLVIIGTLVIIFGVLGAILTEKYGNAVDAIASGLALYLAAAVLDWMGEVLHELQQIKANGERSNLELEKINKRLNAMGDDTNPENRRRSGSCGQAPEPREIVDSFIKGK